MYKTISLLLCALCALCVVMYVRHSESALIVLTVFITVQRGIVSQNYWWWRVSDALNIGSGVKSLYRPITKKIVPKHIMGYPVNVVTDIGFITQILKGSPNVFGVGGFKKAFFKSFMPLNVGVSTGCPWKRRRALNERVLNVGLKANITGVLDKHQPRTFDEFQNAAKLIAMKVVFGLDQVHAPTFKVLEASNNVLVMLGWMRGPNTDEMTQFIKRQLASPRPNSLVSLVPCTGGLSVDELVQQVPHWVFPITGLCSTHLLRLVHIISSSPRIIRKLRANDFDKTYLRMCVLELFRVNNAVNSTFRTLLTDYSFDPEHHYKKGTQFLISNPGVLRNPSFFPNPSAYIPERWTADMEHSFHALMYNQGPQKCPGKELSISILSTCAEHLLHMGCTTTTAIDINHIPETVNPFKLEITF